MSNDKRFAIAILTHNEADRADALLRTFIALVNNTTYGNVIPCYIFVNGSNSDIDTVVSHIMNAYSNAFDFTVAKCTDNNGCSFGVNEVNYMVKDYEYVLFLEGDWVLLNNTPKKWLENCLHHLDTNPNVDQIYLRRITSSLECRQFYGTPYMVDGSMHENHRVFSKSHMHIYTNNPVIRRNKAFYDKGVLPLPYIENETKHSENWGLAEIQHENKAELNSDIYRRGIFVHIFPQWFTAESQFGKGMHFQPCLEHPIPCKECRFGFIHREEPGWCKICLENPTEDYDIIENKYVHQNG